MAAPHNLPRPPSVTIRDKVDGVVRPRRHRAFETYVALSVTQLPTIPAERARGGHPSLTFYRSRTVPRAYGNRAAKIFSMQAIWGQFFFALRVKSASG